MFNRITLLDFRKPLAARKRKHVGPYTWQVAACGEIAQTAGFYMGKGLTVDAHGSSFDLRLLAANDFVASLHLRGITGYYCDNNNDFETLAPIIARLAHSRGYLAGYTMGEGMTSALDRSEVYETPEEAAQAAHDMASRAAEDERDWLL